MANKKISQLDPTILLTGDELIAIVQPVADPKDNRRITLDQIADYTLSGFSGGHIIENSGTPLASQPDLNFTNGLTVVDDVPNTASVVKLGGPINENTEVILGIGAISLVISDNSLNGGGFLLTQLATGEVGVGLFGHLSGGGGDQMSFTLDAEDALGYGVGTKFRDLRVAPKGIEYFGSGYVTQLHSLTDKEFTDANYWKTSGTTTLTSNTSTSGAFTHAFTNTLTTFNSGGLSIFNPAGTFAYNILGSAITSNRTLTIPLLASNDTIVTQDFVQILNNKTLGTGTKVLLGTDATGDLYVNGGSGTLTRLADIATGNVLLSGGVGIAPAYGKVTSSHVDGTIQASGLSWLAASGVALTGANNIVGTTINTLKYTFDNLGTTITDGAGHWLINNTAATSILNQNSPTLTFTGSGWKTNATAESKNISVSTTLVPTTGAADPSCRLMFKPFINGVEVFPNISFNFGNAGGFYSGIRLNGSSNDFGFFTTNGINETRLGTTSNANLDIWTANAQRMRFKTNGEISIGNVTTASGTRLVVNGIGTTTNNTLLLRDSSNTNTFGFQDSGKMFHYVVPTVAATGHELLLRDNTTGEVTKLGIGTGFSISSGSLVPSYTGSNIVHTSKVLSGISSSITGQSTILTSSEISDGQSVTIVLTITGKDDDTNTGFGGILTAVWTKASGTLNLVGETGSPLLSDVGVTVTAATSNSSGNIVVTVACVAGTNASWSIFADLTFRT